MCASGCYSCHSTPQNCGSCCMHNVCNPRCSSSCFPPLERLQPVQKYKWFDCCLENCDVCLPNLMRRCKSACYRNRNVIHALTFLFRCSMHRLMCILFRLAQQQHTPPKRFPRDRVWDVMKNVKAPYSEVHDLAIYDSMYDRCGYPINPLDPDNIFKVVRLMFLTPVLSIDQHKYLLCMLKRLNDRVSNRVDLSRLLNAMAHADIKDLVCSMIEQDKRSARFYAARNCEQLCALYQKVACIDKNEIIRRRKLKTQPKKSPKKSKKTRKVQSPQIYCVRKPTENGDGVSSSQGTGTSTTANPTTTTGTNAGTLTAPNGVEVGSQAGHDGLSTYSSFRRDGSLFARSQARAASYMRNEDTHPRYFRHLISDIRLQDRLRRSS